MRYCALFSIGEFQPSLLLPEISRYLVILGIPDYCHQHWSDMADRRTISNSSPGPFPTRGREKALGTRKLSSTWCASTREGHSGICLGIDALFEVYTVY